MNAPQILDQTLFLSISKHVLKHFFATSILKFTNALLKLQGFNKALVKP